MGFKSYQYGIIDFIPILYVKSTFAREWEEDSKVLVEVCKLP